jgi:hypothetical protein
MTNSNGNSLEAMHLNYHFGIERLVECHIQEPREVRSAAVVLLPKLLVPA